MEHDSNRAKIQNLNKELPISQRSYLLDAIIKFFPDLTEAEKEKVFLATEFLTEKKYRWLLHLYFTAKQHEDPKTMLLAKEQFSEQVKLLIKN